MTENLAESPRKSGLSLKKLLPLLVLAGGFAVFFAAGLHEVLTWDYLAQNHAALMDWKVRNHLPAALALVGIYTVVVTFSLPVAALITPIAGYLFGTVEGGLYSLLGATIGACLVFFAARYALADFFQAKAGKAIRRMEDGFKENALSYMFVLRLVPLFPFFLVNLVPGLLNVPFRAYFIGTVFGMVPGALVYASVGNGLGAVFDQGGTPDLGIIFSPEILVPIVGLALLAMIPVAYKRLRRNRQDMAGAGS